MIKQISSFWRPKAWSIIDLTLA